MKQPSKKKVVEELLRRHGRTFAEEAGIELRGEAPSALFQWLCASVLFSARISNEIAIEAARALFKKGWRTAPKMAESTWEDRTQILNKSGYARYDERTSTMLGYNAELLVTKYHGDLRKLREEAGGDPVEERRRLKQFKGMGETGVDIFFREIQGQWDEIFPFADKKGLKAARALKLASNAKELAGLVRRNKLPELVAALVRCDFAKDHKEIMEEVRR